MPLIDFTLPTDDESPLAFDADYRKAHNALLFFYRGWW